MKFKAMMGSAVQLSSTRPARWAARSTRHPLRRAVAELMRTLEKHADSCVVHLTPDLVTIGVAAEGKDAMHMCADLNPRTLFLDYTVQSKAENNRISFFVRIENLSRALHSASSKETHHIQLKLTKKLGVPAISFEILLSESSVQVSLLGPPRERPRPRPPASGRPPATLPPAAAPPLASSRILPRPTRPPTSPPLAGAARGAHPARQRRARNAAVH